MRFYKSLSSFRNKTSFNRKNSFMVDILLFDHFAIPLTTFIAKNTSLSPNFVTGLSGMFGIAAACLFFLDNVVIGSLLMFISMVLDCVDGNLARLKKLTSDFGASFDIWTDRMKKALSLVALTYITTYSILLVACLILAHYLLVRILPIKISEKSIEIFNSLGIEPPFSAYDLMVILLIIGPLLNFLFVLVIVLLIQVITAFYYRTL